MAELTITGDQAIVLAKIFQRVPNAHLLPALDSLDDVEVLRLVMIETLLVAAEALSPDALAICDRTLETLSPEGVVDVKATCGREQHHEGAHLDLVAARTWSSSRRAT